MIYLENVSKAYNKGAIKAVDNLSLKTEPGEIFGFLGPNGAGKTTAIKMMVGLLQPDSGHIEIMGHSIKSDPLTVKKHISYVPDKPDVYEKLKGTEYLNFMASVYGVSPTDKKQRLERLLSMFELEHAVGNMIQSYSHGMRQKIVLIGALLHDPDVFILDEPMVGLDPKSAKNLKDYMREHCKRGKTVFFSTHVLDVAERFCDRIAIIHHGKILTSGSMDDLKQQAQEHESLEQIFLKLTEV